MNCFGLLLCLSTYLLGGTDAAVTIRIVGGAIAHPNEHKYQISLQVNGRPSCGGSIISGWHILTAAHCVTDVHGQFTTVARTVVAGAFDLNNRGQHAVAIDVEKVYIPTEYKGNVGTPGDIAVLKLSRPLCLCENENLSKVVLPEEDNTYAGVTATITGYGWTWAKLHINTRTREISEEGGADTQKKKFAIADVLSNAECQRVSPRSLTNKQMCARVHQRSASYEGTCTGDSGGPLVYNGNVIIGVLSASPIECNERRFPAIYTRVSAYLNFINNAMAEHELNSMKVYEHSRPGPSSRSTGRPRCSCSHGKNK